jgi:aminopeptidase-like protein
VAAEIYPICRSITGAGVRGMLGQPTRHVELKVREVPTGSRVIDETIPREWTIRDA